MTFVGLKFLSLHFFFVKEIEIYSEHCWTPRFYSIQSLPNTAGLFLFNISQDKSLCSKPSQDSTSDSSHSNSISSCSKLKFKGPKDLCSPLLHCLTLPPGSPFSHSTVLATGLLLFLTHGAPFPPGPLHIPSHISGGFLSNLFRSFLTIHFLRKAFPGYQSYRGCQRRNTILSQIVKESGDSFAFLNYFLHPITFACYCSFIPQISI